MDDAAVRRGLIAACEKITPEWVTAQVQLIRESAGDDEGAHSMEDTLHCAVLQAIAEGCAEDPKLCAFLALSTAEIKFSRWCA